MNRRDFLKFSALLTASTFMRPGLELFPTKLSTDPNAKNVLVILFDTLSASNINFYGYPRETMPHLTRLLDRATVYHNHYASSNFTTPGTASLLTGRHPWEHRAIKISDPVKEDLTNRSIFSFFDDYYTLAYTHNYIAEILLLQFGKAISLHEPFKSLFLEYEIRSPSVWFDNIMGKDIDTANLFKTRLADTNLDGYLYSLLFPSLLGEIEYQPPEEVVDLFPLGIPVSSTDGLYILEDGTEWTMKQSTSMPQPFLGYFHFMPPHSPFSTRKEFVNAFIDDEYRHPEKPMHPVVIPSNRRSREEELENRRLYDEFILYVDAEFNRLFTYLDQQGVLETTLLVITSDHGEIFERNTIEHHNPYLFEPLVNIPLIIFEPGQKERNDIHTLTSCVDVLPTLLHYTGHEIPSGLPGQILPPFSDQTEDISRTVFAMDARWNQDHSHIKTATLMMRKDNWKVIRYSGYADYYRSAGQTNKLDAMQNKSEIYCEVFDLENDPEELNNLAIQPTPEIQALIDEIEQYYRENVEYPQ